MNLFRIISKILVFGLILGLILIWQVKTRAQSAPSFYTRSFQPPPAERYVPDEIIVKFKVGVPVEKIAEVYQKEQIIKEKYVSPFAGFRVLKIPQNKTVQELVYRFQKNPLVDYAEPNHIRYASMIPSDPYYSLQWHFDNDDYGGINMEEAWDITAGNSSIIVAVVDTGVAYEDYEDPNPAGCYDRFGQLKPCRPTIDTYYQAPDLANTLFAPGYDFINNDNHPNDDQGHGTHVTGTVAQSTNNNYGVAGIAFSTKVMPVKVLDANGSGYDAGVADGIYYAVDNGAKIINLSLGGPDPSTTLEDAVSYAYSYGVTVIAASGNDGTESIGYPAAYDAYVIAVGATRYDEAVSYYSNYGSSLDLVAPGGDINVDQNGDGYGDGILQETFDGDPGNFGFWFYQGTSMSTPHVSGVAALILAQNLSFTPDQIRERLQTTAEDKGDSGWDQYYGWGIVDAYQALAPIAISITTDGAVDFGIRALGEQVDTTPSGINDVQTIHVDTGPVKLAVRSTNFSDGSNLWTLNTSNGADQVQWNYSKEGTTWYVFAISDQLYWFVETPLNEGENQNIYFKLTMPTSTSSHNQHGATVTIVAIAP